LHFSKNEPDCSRVFHWLADTNACRRILPRLRRVTEGFMQGEIAGDPELIEPMDGSAGNRSPSCQAMIAGRASRSMVGWRPITKNRRQPGSGANEVTVGLGNKSATAAPVEGDFGGDFVRRNRSQLHHGSMMLGYGQ
jgi:hypothetical protein